VDVFFLNRELSDTDPKQKVQIQLHGSTGNPDPTLFHGSQGQRLFTQTDFVWSMFRAERRPKTDTCPDKPE
jgi:hypothetical protein